MLNTMPPELIQAIEGVRQEIQDEIAYVVWKADPAIKVGTDTFLIRDGKILTQTFLFVS